MCIGRSGSLAVLTASMKVAIKEIDSKIRAGGGFSGHKRQLQVTKQ